MNRRDQKRERHNRRRKERQKELRARKQVEARRLHIDEVPPRDLRRMSALDWGDYEALTFNSVTQRAREMFPRHAELRRFARRQTGRPMSDDAAADLALVLTLAARTVRCDPPWHWPRVIWLRNGDVDFHLQWKRHRLVPDREHGTAGFWGLELPDPDGRMVEVGFTHHAIERLMLRLQIDDPVVLRLFADLWMLFLLPAPETSGSRIDFPRRLTMREGELVVELALHVFDRRESLGYFPVVLTPAGAVAKTFLEPWMSGPAPAVRYTAAEREGFSARYVQEVIPWVQKMLNLGSFVFAGKVHYEGYEQWLWKSYGRLPSRERAWIVQMCEGRTAFDEGRFHHGRSALERGFALLEETLASTNPFFREHIESPKVKTLLSQMRYLLAQVYSRAAAGLDPLPGEAPQDPAEAARFLAKGKALMARVVAEHPDVLGDDPRGDADVARVLPDDYAVKGK